MISNSAGIILRKIVGSSYKLAILDKRHGRVEGVVNAINVGVGSVFEYVLCSSRGRFFLSDLRLVYSPLSLGAADLLFLHHVLELIYYFSSADGTDHGLFDLVAYLYTAEHILMTMKFKKFFLFKLLTMLGVSVDLHGIQLLINQLDLISIDQFNDCLMNQEKERKLDRWLWYCVWQHPYVNEFKTVNFLEENRAI